MKDKGSYQSGQMGQTVNLLAYAFGGSNPSLPTMKPSRNYDSRFEDRRPAMRVFVVAGEGVRVRCVFAEVAQLIEH